MRYMNCLVTGASSGIGKGIAIKLSKHVRHIYIIARNVKKLEETNDEIVKNGCSCTIVPMDLSKEGVIENLSSQIFQKDKFLDLLVLSAGQIDRLSPVESIDLKNFNDILNLNFVSNFRMIKYFHPLLKNSKSSHLAVISSQKKDSYNQYWGIYEPIMSALNEMVMIYAKENMNSNIKVNIYCPKAVNTKLRDITIPGEDKNKLMSPELFASKVVKLLLDTNVTGKFFNF